MGTRINTVLEFFSNDITEVGGSPQQPLSRSLHSTFSLPSELVCIAEIFAMEAEYLYKHVQEFNGTLKPSKILLMKNVWQLERLRSVLVPCKQINLQYELL